MLIENDKKTNFGRNFGPIGSKFFCGSSYLYLIFDVAASYYCMQLQVKLINQILENGKKPSFGTNLGPFDSNLGCQKFPSKVWLHQSLETMVSYHYVQY